MTHFTQTHQVALPRRQGRTTGLKTLVLAHFQDRRTFAALTPEQLDDNGLNAADVAAAAKISLWQKVAEHFQNNAR